MKAFLITGFCLSVIALPAAGQQDTSGTNAVQRSLLLKQVIISPAKSVSRSERDLHQNHLMSLTDKILERTPGITMIRRGNFAMEPAFRSLNNGQITLTIEGMRIFGACTDRMDPVSSYIEPNNLESIALTESPGENANGSGIGGGIDFKLKQPSFSESAKTSAMIGSGYETNGSAFQTLAGINVSNRSFALQANGIFRRSGNYRAANRGEISFSQYRKWNGSISAIVKTGGKSFLKGDYIQDEGFDIGYPALTMDVAFAKARIAALSYHYRDTQRHITWETKGYYNFVDHAMDDTKRPAETISMHMDMPGTSRTFGAFSSLAIGIHPKHHLEAKLDGFRNELSAEMTMYPPGASPMFMYTLAGPVRNSIGLSLSDIFSINEKLTFRPGLWMEYMHDDIHGKEEREQLSGMFEGNLAESRLLSNINLGISYNPTTEWTLGASASRGARASTLQESYAFYIYNRPDGYDYIGNPSLKQESSYNLSCSGAYHNSNFRAELNVFSYFFRNYIAGRMLQGYSTMTIGAMGVKQYINLPSAKIYGTEFALRWAPAKTVTLSSVNTFTRGEDNEGIALPLIAPFKTVNSVMYSAKKTIIQAETVTNSSQSHVDMPKYGETPTPGSTVVNLSAGRSVPIKPAKSLKVSVLLENVFNRSYYQHLDILKIPRPGRNLIFRTSLFL